MRPLTVGLTFFLRRGDRSIWSNGADQNCVFLWQLLRTCPGVERVYAINGGDADAPAAGMMLGNLGIEFVRLEEVIDQLDVLIEAGAQVEAAALARVRVRGGRTVAYRFGNALLIDAERIIHDKPAGSIFNDSCFDEVWTHPQHVRSCGSYWATCYRAPVRVLPHIWEPTFIDATAAEFPAGLTFGYQPGRRAKRVVIFEPNVNLVKTSVIPMLICEQAYRRRPDLVGSVQVTNAAHLKEHLTFQRFAANLDIVRHKAADGHAVCSFEARYNLPWFLATHGDIVVAHQVENGLNYAYYDALYGAYPLIHNSDLLPPGVGYRYEGFDAHDGGGALLGALQAHDQRAEEYAATARAFLATVRATSADNIEAHMAALRRLMGVA